MILVFGFDGLTFFVHSSIDSLLVEVLESGLVECKKKMQIRTITAKRLPRIIDLFCI